MDDGPVTAPTVSTPETRQDAVHAVVEAYATLEAANRLWPEIRFLKKTGRRAREENNFGPKVRRMLET